MVAASVSLHHDGSLQPSVFNSVALYNLLVQILFMYAHVLCFNPKAWKLTVNVTELAV